MAVALEITESGTLLLPERTRRKYGLTPGTRVLLEDLGGALVLTTSPSRVDELGAEIEGKRKAAGLRVEDLLDGLADQRRRYGSERRARA